MYPQDMVLPMQAELTAAGFQDLHNAAEEFSDFVPRRHSSTGEALQWSRSV